MSTSIPLPVHHSLPNESVPQSSSLNEDHKCLSHTRKIAKIRQWFSETSTKLSVPRNSNPGQTSPPPPATAVRGQSRPEFDPFGEGIVLPTYLRQKKDAQGKAEKDLRFWTSWWVAGGFLFAFVLVVVVIVIVVVVIKRDAAAN